MVYCNIVGRCETSTFYARMFFVAPRGVLFPPDEFYLLLVENLVVLGVRVNVWVMNQ